MALNFGGKRQGFLRGAVYVLPPFGLSLLFYSLSINEISLLQLVLAIILLLVPWSYYLKWKQHQEPGLPIFAIISFMYWICFTLSLFLARALFPVSRLQVRHTSRMSHLRQRSEMAVVAITCMWLGMKSGIARRLIPKRMPMMKEGNVRVHYIRAVLFSDRVAGVV